MKFALALFLLVGCSSASRMPSSSAARGQGTYICEERLEGLARVDSEEFAFSKDTLTLSPGTSSEHKFNYIVDRDQLSYATSYPMSGTDTKSFVIHFPKDAMNHSVIDGTEEISVGDEGDPVVWKLHCTRK